MLGQETIERTFRLAGRPGLQQRLSPGEVYRRERRIEQGGTLVIGQSRRPVAMVAMELTPLQVERRVLRVLLEQVRERGDLLVDRAVGRRQRREPPEAGKGQEHCHAGRSDNSHPDRPWSSHVLAEARGGAAQRTKGR